MEKGTVLVTGGAGFIGSHVVVKLLEENYKVVIIDNFHSSYPTSIEGIKQITKCSDEKLKFYEIDIRDINKLDEIFKNENIKSVIHFAALKSIPESVKIPMEYYDINIGGTVNLLKIMNKYNVNNMVFSSSGAVYGEAHIVPLKEEHISFTALSPYGRTKQMGEIILKDWVSSNKNSKVMALRYFNPIGSHPSHLIGDNPKIPGNIIPVILDVMAGKRQSLKVFGNDYPTPDGTCLRDYVHIMDIADGHILALHKLEEINTNDNNDNDKQQRFFAYNLGTGKATSVLTLIKTMEEVSGTKIPYEIAPRRDGDVPTLYADISKVKEELGFIPKYTVEDMCRDSFMFNKFRKDL